MDEAKLEALQAKHGKVGAITFGGHDLGFRRPTRAQVHEYRRKVDSASEKMDAMDQLAQATIIYLDGEEDATRARMAFTGKFLEDYPMATSNPRFANLLCALAGLIEEEDALDLGKGVTVRSATRAPSLTASPNGSGASSTGAS